YFHPPVTAAPHRALGCDARRIVELEGTTSGRGKRLTFLPSAGALLQLAGDLLVARDLTSVSGRQRVADDAAPIDDEEPHVVVGQELGQLAEERLGRPKVVRRWLRLHPLQEPACVPGDRARSDLEAPGPPGLVVGIAEVGERDREFLRIASGAF